MEGRIPLRASALTGLPVSYASALRWMQKRASFIQHPDDLGWVETDPLVGRFLPFLYFPGVSACPFAIPKAVHRRARLAYYDNAAYWLRIESRLQQVLHLMADAGVEVLPLKGAILWSELYGSTGLRRMNDIDLLVRETQLPRAAQILLEAGFRLHRENNFQDLGIFSAPRPAWPCEVIFQDGRDGRFVIELHSSLVTTPWLAPLYRVKMDEVRQRAVPAESAADRKTGWQRKLSAMDTLAGLILHQALHGLQAEQTYLDIDLFIRSLPPNWDWQAFREHLLAWHMQHAAYQVLSFATRFMDTPLPVGFLEQMKPATSLCWVIQRLLTPEKMLACQPGAGSRYPTLVKWLIADNVGSIFQALFGLLFPPKAWRLYHLQDRSLLEHWIRVWQVVRNGD